MTTHPTNSWLTCCVLLLILQCYCTTRTTTWAFTPSASVRLCHSLRSNSMAFAAPQVHRSVSCRIIRMAASKDDEIAALEEKLRLLKEDADAVAPSQETNVNDDETDSNSTSNSSVQEDEEFSWKVPETSTSKRRQGENDTTIAVRKVPVASMDDPFDEMLSEQWKVSKNRAVPKGSSNNGSGIGGSIKTIVGVVALLLGVVAFSQIPVGQEDLDKYSTAKPSTTIDLGDLNPVKINSIGLD